MKKILLVVCAVCFIFTANTFAEEFSADVNSVAAGMNTTSKIYYKDFDTARSEAMGMITITNGKNTYQLFDSTKKYVVMDMEAYKQQNPMADVDDFEGFIKQNDIKKVGTESVNGYKCDVYEGSVTYDAGQEPLAMKLWYSSKLDYPIKTESQIPGGMGTAVSTLENIKTGKQPDSLFEIPEGYTQAQSMEEAMGMGGFGGFSSMFGGGGDDDADDADDEEEADGEAPAEDGGFGGMMKMMKGIMGGGD